MDKNIFDRLMRMIQNKPINSYQTEELRSLAEFYQALHFLISTLHWLEMEYGPRKKIENQMKEIGYILYEKLPILSPNEQASNLNTLFELSALLNDTQIEDQTTEKALLLLERKETINDETAHCLLAANLYYQLREEEHQNMAIQLINKWIEETPQASRLLAINNYQALTLDYRYENYLNKVFLPRPTEKLSFKEENLWAQWILYRYPFNNLEVIKNMFEFYLLSPNIFNTNLQINCLNILITCFHQENEKKSWQKIP